MSALALPTDIVAIDSGNKSYLFYVNGSNKLSYLESPDETGTGNFVRKVVEIDGDDVFVNPETRQVAAITWNQQSAGTKEIRVYYANPKNILKEACKSGDGPWYEGALSGASTKHKLVKNSPISATVHLNKDKQWNLRVFAAKDADENEFDIQQMSAWKFLYNENGQNTGNWNPDVITNTIKKY